MRRILVAEDDPGALDLLTLLLESEGHAVIQAEDGRKALREVENQDVDLVVLDVMMPGTTGFSVCRKIKANPKTKLLPIVLVTGLTDSADRVLGIEAGADDFLSKPIRREELLARVRSLLRIKDYVDELEESETVLSSLALSIEAKDPYTEGHCQRLAQYAAAFGTRLGLGEDEMTALRRGAILHDIGKVAVPEHILRKAGPLTLDERATMKLHPAAGEKICLPLRSMAKVLPIIRHHHEKLNGEGYPDGLKNGRIPLAARILTTVDVFDALTTDRPYHARVSRDAALAIMVDEAKGGYWDPELVKELPYVIPASAMAWSG